MRTPDRDAKRERPAQVARFTASLYRTRETTENPGKVVPELMTHRDKSPKR